MQKWNFCEKTANKIILNKSHRKGRSDCCYKAWYSTTEVGANNVLFTNHWLNNLYNFSLKGHHSNFIFKRIGRLKLYLSTSSEQNHNFYEECLKNKSFKEGSWFLHSEKLFNVQEYSIEHIEWIILPLI